MIEHEFCIATDISKILAKGELSSWAGHRLGKQTFVSPECCRTTSDTESFEKGGPDRHITFHKNRTLHLPAIS